MAPDWCPNRRVCTWVVVLCLVVVRGLLSPRKLPATQGIIDLRSDTLTKPSPAMRKLMFEAEVGDDVFREDPTVNKLEDRVARMFRKESSLFFPTGTMANLAASMSWCTNRGSEAIVGDCSHIYLYEQANLAQIAGISPRAVPNGADGSFDIDRVEAAIRTDNVHFPVTSLISIENTHNYCGGRVLPAGYTESIAQLAKRNNIPLHLDGARIWNAATAQGVSVDQLVAPADSVTACLSKGLGAPAGSMLVGPRSFIERARRIRKALGGGMRQVGVLAAAGLQALDDFEGGMLASDHRRARFIAESLADVAGLRVDTAAVETNIVLLHLEAGMGTPAEFAARLREQHGVLVLPFGPRSVRLVTHRDLVEEDVASIVWAVRDVAAQVVGGAGQGSARATFADMEGQTSVEAVEAVPLVPAKDGDASEAVAAVALQEDAEQQKDQQQQKKSEGADTEEHYEEVLVRGMSVSPEGFCVLLQGTVSDRCVRVLVTPEDPMSDGLDHDEVESSEAVTLLQLLQGIDVETYLAKDALATKFAGNGRPKCDLKAVLLNGVGRGKEFQALLVGITRKPTPEHPVPASTVEVIAPTGVNAEKDGTVEDMGSANRTAENIVLHTQTPPVNETTAVSREGAVSPQAAATATVSRAASSANNATALGYDRAVPIESAFYAIALALRHQVPIEVRSDLLRDDRRSFPESDVPALFPRLLAAPPLPSGTKPATGLGNLNLLERLEARLAVATRLRNEAKIDEISAQIRSLSTHPEPSPQSVHAAAAPSTAQEIRAPELEPVPSFTLPAAAQSASPPASASTSKGTKKRESTSEKRSQQFA